LREEEVQLAADLARSDARVRELLGEGRNVLAAVEPVALKRDLPRQDDPSNPADIGRHARVLFYRYEGNLGVGALVDLRARAVAEVQQMNGDDVPMAFEELAEARNIALRDETLGRLLGGEADRYRVSADSARRGEFRVEGLRVQATERQDPCWEHRCVALLFRRADGSYLAGTDVVVDLTAGTAVVQQVPDERRKP
jgi:hypothetical protein